MSLLSKARRLDRLERRAVALSAVFVVYVDPPEGVAIDNRTVFKSLEDIPASLLASQVAIYGGFDPDWI